MQIRRSATEDKAYSGFWFHERNRGFYFGCSFSAAELMQ
jgi:hypothetical protein